MLREYQESIVDNVVNSSDNVIISLPTGGGKSHIIQQIVHRDRSNKYAIVVRNSPLIPQLIDRMKEIGLNVGVIKAGFKYDSSKSYDAYLIMEQTYYARKMTIPEEIDVVMKDEFHIGFNGDQFNYVKDTLKPSRVIGLTATPITENGIGINYVIDDNYRLLEGVDTQYLMDKGYLSKVEYQLPRNSSMERLLSKVKKQGADYSTGELELILNTEEHNTFVVNEVVSKCVAKGRKTLVFANSVAHVKALSAAFTNIGIDNVSIHSRMSQKDSEVALDLYKSGTIPLMINMSMLTTGFDDPATNAVVLVRPTKVLRLYLQIVGRGLRAMNGKDNCLVLDLSNSLKEHGFAEAKRSFNIRDKDEYEAHKAEQEVDELPEVKDVDGVVTAAKVIEYRINTKQRRIDELLNKVELQEIELHNKRSVFEHLQMATKTINTLRATNASLNRRLCSKQQPVVKSKQVERVNPQKKYIDIIKQSTDAEEILHNGAILCSMRDLAVPKQDTRRAILRDFNSSGLDIRVLKEKLARVLKRENGEWDDGSPRSMSSMKTYFTYLANKEGY